MKQSVKNTIAALALAMGVGTASASVTRTLGRTGVKAEISTNINRADALPDLPKYSTVLSPNIYGSSVRSGKFAADLGSLWDCVSPGTIDVKTNVAGEFAADLNRLPHYALPKINDNVETRVGGESAGGTDDLVRTILQRIASIYHSVRKIGYIADPDRLSRWLVAERETNKPVPLYAPRQADCSENLSLE